MICGPSGLRSSSGGVNWIAALVGVSTLAVILLLKGSEPCLEYPNAALAYCASRCRDRTIRAVRFTMSDGSRPVDVLVSNPALESIDIVPIEQDNYFATFKLYRKSFERIASQKYDKGHVEADAPSASERLMSPAQA